MSKSTLKSIIAKLTNDQVSEATKQLTQAFDERKAFEEKKNPAREKFFAGLEKSRKELSKDHAIKTLIAAGSNPGFMNTGQHKGARYSLYASHKLIDLVAAIDSGIMSNKVNNAITRSLFAFKNAGEQFTGEMAKACVSDKIRVQGQIAKVLIRHNADASTAPTQASSTLQALETLGVIKNTGTQRAAVYELQDTPQTRRLEEIVAKAA